VSLKVSFRESLLVKIFHQNKLGRNYISGKKQSEEIQENIKNNNLLLFIFKNKD